MTKGCGIMKMCKSCGQNKDLDQFYQYQKYGKTYYTGRCKPCKLEQNKQYRDTTQYDKKRYRRDKDKLVEQQKAYAKTDQGQRSRLQASKRYRETPEGRMKQRARAVINHGLRDGKVIRPPSCESCGGTTPVEAHHEDYSKPLDVQWVCKACHENIHHLNEGSTS